MGMRVTELECKEVVCVGDGSRLGFVTDVVVDECDGCIKAIVVPGKGKFCGIYGAQDEFVIPWKCICRIGDDIILVDIKPSECRSPKGKQKWFH